MLCGSRLKGSEACTALFSADGSHLNPWRKSVCVCVYERERTTLHTLDHSSSNRWAAQECVNERVLVITLQQWNDVCVCLRKRVRISFIGQVCVHIQGI